MKNLVSAVWYQRGRPREGAWFVDETWRRARGAQVGAEGKKRKAHHSRKIRVASQYQERPCKLARGNRKGKHITVGKYALLRNVKKDPNSMIEKILQLVKKLFLSFMIDRVVSKY